MDYCGVLFGVLLLLPNIIIAQMDTIENLYFLAVTSKAVGGTTEKLCVTLKLRREASLEVNLEHKGNRVSILNEKDLIAEYHHCAPFQVPVVVSASLASINIQIKGVGISETMTTTILITPPTQLTIIQTDKPIYKAGQTVNFRIVSLDSSFLTYNQTFRTIEVQDPNSNRIGQWLNVTTSSGLVDLSYPINSEATKGNYRITVWNEKNEAISESFEVKDYVLPTFEMTVQLPPVITILDESATLKVCGKYIYGKPVNGTVKATVCHNRKGHWWQFETPIVPDICKEYIMQTDQTGCGQQVLSLKELALTDSRYQAGIKVQSEVEEYGTGVIWTGSGSSRITSDIVTISYEDSPKTFKLGMMYRGKIKVTGPNSSPMKRKVVHLTINYDWYKKSTQRLVTNENGIAEFALNTEAWGSGHVHLKAQYETTNRPDVVYEENQRRPNFPIAELSLEPFYSKSRSFIQLKSRSEPLSCNKYAQIEAQYKIHNIALNPHQKTLYFFYMVMSKGHLVQHGVLPQTVQLDREVQNGILFLLLKNMVELSPVAQVVLYTVLSSGEVVADTMSFPIQLCLANKVSLNFSRSSELPGGQVSLMLRATPGSLCSLRAIDQSLLLLKPEKELSIESMLRMPDQTISRHIYYTYDEMDRCLDSDSDNNANVHRILYNAGIKILSNALVRNPDVSCSRVQSMIVSSGSIEREISDNWYEPVVTIRKYFPETWIWDLVSVRQSGMMAVNKTVPDSITTWQADAFCTSPVGFGFSPKTELTAFQPFFVSLTLPNSVIRGEVFTLKASVFNYLQSCMMVKVTLDDSQQFSAQVCKDCTYTRCLCAEEGRTFSWTITPLFLGEVTISVTAEAMQSTTLCGQSAVTVPETGRIDTVIKTLLVKAEGTKQYKSYNELICPDGVVEKTISLNLPMVVVNGSAMASVSVLGSMVIQWGKSPHFTKRGSMMLSSAVYAAWNFSHALELPLSIIHGCLPIGAGAMPQFGDLMGRALQNLASLLAMPYGCGEQNMLRFAPNIFILQYLEGTNQLTPEIRNIAETYLVSGYQRELSYKHNDGSYSAFGESDPSGNTWLTAFVMKSFGSAKRYIFIDQLFVDQAKVWLGQQQQPNGCFASVGRLFQTKLKGGVNDNVTLSAYITAAMLELGYTVTDPVVKKSLNFLWNVYPLVDSTYTKALLFYTFTLAGHQEKRNKLISDLDSKAIISGGRRHWSRVNNGSVTDSLEVEMTSYVLLGLMSGPQISGFDLHYSTSIVQWLSQQQNAFGGFASTQDTVVALQALAKYSSATYSPSGSVNIIITSPSGLIKTFNITQSNRLLYQESQLQEVTGNYSIKAQGKSCVYVQFTSSYNIPPPPDFSSFAVSATASGDCRVPDPSLEVTITVTYNGQRLETNMVIINVKLLSGFSVDMNSVQLVNSRSSPDGSVKRVDQADGEVNIYLNEMVHGEEKVYTLTIMQDIAVENLKPAVVKVYDYYETGDSAVTDYTSPCT